MAIDETAWDITDPATSDDISAGAEDIREFKEQIELRLNKANVALANSSAGGEPLEGSARINTATSAPVNLVVGASGGDVTISGNEALAEGAVWVDTDSGYTVQVYAASAWHDLGYVSTSGGSVITTAASASTEGLEVVGGATPTETLVRFTGAASTSQAVQTVTTGSSSSGAGLSIATGTSSSGVGLAITSGTSSSGNLISVSPSISGSRGILATATNNAFGIDVQNSGTNHGVTCTSSSTGNCYDATMITSSANGFSAVMLGSSTGNGVNISSSSGATGVGINISMAASDEPHFKLDTCTTASIATPANGHFWFDGSNLLLRVGGADYTLDKTAV